MEYEKEALKIKLKNMSFFEQKNHSLQEQLENKDTHLDILRRKIAQLEECKVGRSEIKKEIDEQTALNKKIAIKAERLSVELTNLRNENIQLKANILDIESLSVRLDIC